MRSLDPTQKVEAYDFLVKQINARSPSLARVLGQRVSGEPVRDLLTAFDVLIDEDKRAGLGDLKGDARLLARVRERW